MADQDIKDFAVTWILFGLLVFSLLSFTIGFIYQNNPDALDNQSKSKLNSTAYDLQNTLVEIETTSNSQINVSADLESEESQIGTRAAASTSYGLTGTAVGFWDKTKILFSWVFSGLIGQIIIGVFGGILGIIGLYYAIKLIRSLF